MAKMEIKGIDDYMSAIEKLENSDDIAGHIVYEGAKVMADALKTAIGKIPEAEEDSRGNPVRNKQGKIKGITKQQRKDLENGFGITKAEKTPDGINVKVGFGGYGSTKTRRYPKGLPNEMLARAVTSGTSFRVKSPVLRTTQTRMKKPTLLAMEKEADRIIREKMEK